MITRGGREAKRTENKNTSSEFNKFVLYRVFVIACNVDGLLALLALITLVCHFSVALNARHSMILVIMCVRAIAIIDAFSPPFFFCFDLIIHLNECYLFDCCCFSFFRSFSYCIHVIFIQLVFASC